MYIVYNFLLFLTLPYILFRMIRKHKDVKERFAFYAQDFKGGNNIWVHAVSVGEVVASQSLIRQLKEKLPQFNIIVSTTTATGRNIARQRVGEDASIIYFPLDLPRVVKRALEQIKPKIVILTETELWPNLLKYCQIMHIPVVVVNGRISRLSYRRLCHLRFLFRWVLDKVSVFCMQSELDAQKIISLGAELDEVKVTGNSKFDSLPSLSSFNKEEFLKEWHIKDRSPIIVAGSTHPGEEELFLESFLKVKEEFPSALLILVPRHPERCPEVANILAKYNCSFLLRSKIGNEDCSGRPACPRRFASQSEAAGAGGACSARELVSTNSINKSLEAEVLLVDTIGELQRIYVLADIVFMGGSLVPRGGHNPLEPAALGKPVITGPYISNFKEIYSLFLDQGGAVRVVDSNGLTSIFLKSLKDQSQLQRMGKRGLEIVASRQGATRKNLEIIEALL